MKLRRTKIVSFFGPPCILTWPVSPECLLTVSQFFSAFTLLVWLSKACVMCKYWCQIFDKVGSISEKVARSYSFLSQKSSPPPKTFWQYFHLRWSYVTENYLLIAHTYSYAYTNFGTLIWIFVWIVSLLIIRSLKFYQFNLVYYEIH